MGLALAQEEITDFDTGSNFNDFSVNTGKTAQQEKLHFSHYDEKPVEETEKDSVAKGQVFDVSRPVVEPEIQNPTNLKREVDGAVDEIDTFAITCELEVKENTYVKIQLPSSFYPVDVFVGMPITLSLDDSSGYSTPSIKKRNVHENEKKKYQEEIESLINEL